MVGTYFYEFQIGTRYFSRFGLDDRQARRLLTRWISMFWSKHRSGQRSGSIAAAIDRDSPDASIFRRWCSNSDCPIVPFVDATLIERFRVDSIGLGEFDRLYRN